MSIQAFFSHYPFVVGVYLYGSHARGTQNTLSDIDIAVMIDPVNLATVDFHLKSIGKLMEIFKMDNVDVQMLTIDTPPVLARAMLGGKLIYCREIRKKADIEAQLLSRYQDIAPFLSLQRHHMLERIARGTYAAG